MKMQKNSILLIMSVLISINSFCQQKIRLSDKLRNDKIKAVNRTLSLYGENSGAVEMNAENSSGMGIIEDIEFEKGRIEIELLGENNPGKSFIGIAFNIENDETYEAVYFRPFNFVAKEPIRKEHMVQYIYHPEFTWRKLREERTGEFENEINMPPDPDNWFKAIIHITEKKVNVYVNDLTEPVLTVDRLSSTKTKSIGIWTGFGSSGRFRNLVINE